MVFAFIIENNMNTLGGVTTNVWAKHNVVFGFAVHVFGSDGRWENLEKIENVVIFQKKYFTNFYSYIANLNITTTAINFLLMLNCELNDQSLILV